MGRHRELPPQANTDLIADRFNAAVNYATEMLYDFLEASKPIRVAVLLDWLTDEYWKARRERRGMDSDIVKIAVQGIIDAAKFSPENRPDEYDHDDTASALASEPDLPPPIFRFVCSVGADPRAPEKEAALLYTLGEVMSRYELKLYRNVQPKTHKPLDGKISACDAVAAANARLGQTPATYSALRKMVGASNHRIEDGAGKRLPASNYLTEMGKYQGNV